MAQPSPPPSLNTPLTLRSIYIQTGIVFGDHVLYSAYSHSSLSS